MLNAVTVAFVLAWTAVRALSVDSHIEAAVSYTHLDVYKRQESGFEHHGYEPQRGAFVLEGAHAHVLVLRQRTDVYKRQVFTLLLSFTGYLLPDDQLGFWAVTVGLSLIHISPPCCDRDC